MSFINYDQKEINFKIVYYGPAMAGKTTSISYIHDNLEKKDSTNLISQATENDRLLFYNFLYSNKDINGYKIRIHLCTVPGAIFYPYSKIKVLKDLDGLIFVADSQVERIDANFESFWELKRFIQFMGYDISYIPMITQLNKRDLNNIIPLEDIKQPVDIEMPVFESVAYKGIGVWDSINFLIDAVIKNYSTNNSINIKKEISLESWLQTLNNGNRLERFCAILNLSDRISDESVEDESMRTEAKDILKQVKNKDVVDALVKALMDKEESIRLTAAQLIKEIVGNDSLNICINWIHNSEESFRVSGIKALSTFKDNRLAIDEVIKYLTDISHKIRCAAIDSIFLLLGAESFDYLINALKDESILVRFKAVTNLGKLSDKRAGSYLIQMIERNDIEDKHSSLRGLVADALVEIGDAKAIAKFHKIITKENLPLYILMKLIRGFVKS